MAAAKQQMNLPVIGGLDLNAVQGQFNDWLSKQPPAVEVLVTGLTSSVQGVFLGYVFGSISAMEGPETPGMEKPAALKAMTGGGPLAQARNLGVMTGVNAAANLAIKKARQGKDDVWTAMGAAFFSGAAYALVSGSPNPAQAAFTTGTMFAAFNGIFYQLGGLFKGDDVETDYDRGKYMLKTLGLDKYANNLKKGKLTDSTIMLWNDSALAEAKIPAGPRLLILHHLDAYRSPSSVLKPALAVPMYPVQPPPRPAPGAPAAAPGALAAAPKPAPAKQ